MKHTVHETDFLCRHKVLFLRVWPRSSQTVPVNAGRHCRCSLGVQPADLETSASCSDTRPWRHLNGERQSSGGTESAGDVRSDKSRAPTEYRYFNKKIELEKAQQPLLEGFDKNMGVSIHNKKTLSIWLLTHFCLSSGKCLNLRCPATLWEEAEPIIGMGTV